MLLRRFGRPSCDLRATFVRFVRPSCDLRATFVRFVRPSCDLRALRATFVRPSCASCNLRATFVRFVRPSCDLRALRATFVRPSCDLRALRATFVRPSCASCAAWGFYCFVHVVLGACSQRCWPSFVKIDAKSPKKGVIAPTVVFWVFWHFPARILPFAFFGKISARIVDLPGIPYPPRAATHPPRGPGHPV